MKTEIKTPEYQNRNKDTTEDLEFFSYDTQEPSNLSISTNRKTQDPTPRRTEDACVAIAEEIYTKLNPEGQGCLKLQDLDELLVDFTSAKRAALKRFFNQFITNTNLFMMSKQFFTSNLAKAYAEDSFELSPLFDNVTATTKAQFDKLVHDKFEQIKNQSKDKYSAQQVRRMNHSSNEAVVKNANDKSPEKTNPKSVKYGISQNSRVAQHIKNSSKDFEKQNKNITKQPSNNQIETDVTLQSKNSISSLETSIESAMVSKKYIKNDKTRVLTKEESQDLIQRLSQNPPKKIKKTVSPTVIKRVPFAQSPNIAKSKSAKPILKNSRNESQKSVKFSNKPQEQIQEQPTNYQNEKQAISNQSQESTNSNNSNKSLRENLNDLSNVNQYSEIDDQLNEIREIIDNNLTKNYNMQKSQSPKNKSEKVFGENTIKKVQLLSTKEKPQYDYGSRKSNQFKSITSTAKFNSNLSNGAININNSDINTITNNQKGTGNPNRSSLQSEQKRNYSLHQTKPTSKVNKSREERDLEDCTFQPKLNSGSKTQSRLQDWMRHSKHTIASSNLDYYQRVTASTKHKKQANSKDRNSFTEEDNTSGIHTNNSVNKLSSISAKKSVDRNGNDSISRENELLQSTNKSTKKKLNDQELINKSVQEVKMNVKGSDRKESIGYQELQVQKQQQEARHLGSNQVTRNACGGALDIQGTNQEIINIQNAKLPLCSLNFKQMQTNNDVVEARKRLFQNKY